MFFSGKEWPPELTERVQGWLVNGRYCMEKEIAMRRVFYDFMDGKPIDGEAEDFPDYTDTE